jgi:uncharacterized protein YecA (UPF0149 family)
MATEAQLSANRENAKSSTGPRTAPGRARSSQNALRFGLFSAKNCVRPDELAEYEALTGALWNELRPESPLQELCAVEVLRAAWRLRRCTEVEAVLAERSLADPMLDAELLRTQAAVDRARSQAHGILRRSLNDLRRLRNEQNVPAKPTQSGAADPPSPPSVHPATPRNAACPCRSGQKYKRCCGRNAPALLHQAA